MCERFSFGEFSDAEVFRTADIADPYLDPPPMIAPADRTESPSLTVAFSWGDAAGATGYRTQLYDSLSAAESEGWFWSYYGGSSFLSHTHTFHTAGTYYWRVQAGNDTAWGTLSPIRSVTIGGATLVGYSISGRVIDDSGRPIPNVQITAGGDHSGTSDESGAYALTELVTGTYTITPSLAGFTFDPAAHTVSVPPDTTGQDFIGTKRPLSDFVFLPLVTR